MDVKEFLKENEVIPLFLFGAFCAGAFYVLVGLYGISQGSQDTLTESFKALCNFFMGK